MNRHFEREKFLASFPAEKGTKGERIQAARLILWQTFRPHKLYVAVAEQGIFAHLGTTSEYLDLTANYNRYNDELDAVRREYKLLRHAKRFSVYHHSSRDEGIHINTLVYGHGTIERGCLVEHSSLNGNFHIER